MKRTRTVLVSGLLLAVTLTDTGCTKSAPQQQPTTISLHEAARRGNLKQIETHIAAGDDLDARDENEATALFEAMAYDELDIAKALLEGGAGIDTPGPHGRTPLHLMAMDLNVNGARFLLEHGASVDARDTTKYTPLHYVAMAEWIPPEKALAPAEFLSVLIEHGADLEARAENNLTPLHTAIYFGDVQIITALIDQGANVNMITGDGADTLGLAVSVRRENENELVKIVRELVQAGADVRYRHPDNGATALHLLTWMGTEDAVDLLLQNDADPNLQNKDGNTALHAACTSGQRKIIASLVAHGADPEIANNRGQKPLDVAPADLREAIRQAVADGLKNRKL